MTERAALLAGATGLIGSQVLDLLLADPTWSRVVSLVRWPRQESSREQKLTERVVDFDSLSEVQELPPIDDAFCCLGTTMKQAGSRAAFRRVDHDYVVATARLALANGARRFLLVTAVGSSPKALNYYSRVKAEVESSVAGLGFEALHIFQPSILFGNRRESRPGERLGITAAKRLNWTLIGPLRRFRGIDSARVAKAMVQAAKSETTGRQIYVYDDLERLARAAGTRSRLAQSGEQSLEGLVTPE